MHWALRPVTPADQAFLLQVYASTRADELALTGWDTATREAFVRQQAQAQVAHYQGHWPDALHQVISCQDPGPQGNDWHDVGRLWLNLHADASHVLDIALLAEWRGRGLGQMVLRRVMREAAACGRDVTIYVEAGNPARRLYDRLGFLPIGQPDGLHQLMRWSHVTITPMETCHEQA